MWQHSGNSSATYQPREALDNLFFSLLSFKTASLLGQEQSYIDYIIPNTKQLHSGILLPIFPMHS